MEEIEEGMKNFGLLIDTEKNKSETNNWVGLLSGSGEFVWNDTKTGNEFGM